MPCNLPESCFLNVLLLVSNSFETNVNLKKGNPLNTTKTCLMWRIPKQSINAPLQQRSPGPGRGAQYGRCRLLGSKGSSSDDGSRPSQSLKPRFSFVPICRNRRRTFSFLSLQCLFTIHQGSNGGRFMRLFFLSIKTSSSSWAGGRGWAQSGSQGAFNHYNVGISHNVCTECSPYASNKLICVTAGPTKPKKLSSKLHYVCLNKIINKT